MKREPHTEGNRSGTNRCAEPLGTAETDYRQNKAERAAAWAEPPETQAPKARKGRGTRLRRIRISRGGKKPRGSAAGEQVEGL